MTLCSAGEGRIRELIAYKEKRHLLSVPRRRSSNLTLLQVPSLARDRCQLVYASGHPRSTLELLLKYAESCDDRSFTRQPDSLLTLPFRSYDRRISQAFVLLTLESTGLLEFHPLSSFLVSRSSSSRLSYDAAYPPA